MSPIQRAVLGSSDVKVIGAAGCESGKADKERKRSEMGKARVDLATIHRRLAHLSPNAIRKLVNSGAIEGIKLIDDVFPAHTRCVRAS